MHAVFHMERPSPRARYLIGHLLGGMMGRELVEETDRQRFDAHQGPRLYYGEGGPADAFVLTPSPTLDRGLPPLDPQVDPLGAAFHLLTLAHETGLPEDEHGRPDHEQLQGWTLAAMERPVVDEWALALDDAWSRQDHRLPPRRRSYTQVVTLDLDNGFKYLGRPWWRTLGSAARDVLNGRFRELGERRAVLMGQAEDPYVIDELFEQVTSRYADRTVVNLLVAERGRHDHAVPLAFPPMAERARALSRRHAIGLHPSYASSEVSGATAREKSRLEAVIGSSVKVSRQHFLRFKVPGTFVELEGLGIREEHSLGFSRRTGFRCGTCTPFPWYDRKNERRTELECWPFQVMDSALAYGMRLGPEAAVQEALRMSGAVRQVAGTFVSVWHERFISGHGREAGWEVVLPRVAEGAAP